MSNRFYQCAISSLGLTIAAGLFQSILHFQLGVDLYFLPSLGLWVSLMNAIELVSSGFILYYYYRRSYWAALVTGAVATLAGIGGYLFLIVALLDPPLVRYMMPVLSAAVLAGIGYAISLIVSRAAGHPWLKRAGILTLVLGLVQLAAIVWFWDTPPAPVNATLDTIRKWVSLADRGIPVLFIMNFLREARPLTVVSKPTGVLSRSELGLAVVVLLAVCSFVLGVKLAGESYQQTHVSRRAMALAQPFDVGLYVSSQGNTLQYRLLKPPNYDPRKKYPLVVCLPYTCWQDNVRQIESCPPARWLSTDTNRKKYPAFVFVPRCPPHTGWGGVPNTPSVDSLAIEAIMALDQTFSIDANRRYVTGVSRGGYGSWQFISTHPELFAAAVPVCSAGDPGRARNAVGVSVWAFHGAQDRNVPVNGSRDMIAALRKAGGQPRYTEYPEAAHNIWDEVEKTPGLLEWLFAQQRN